MRDALGIPRGRGEHHGRWGQFRHEGQGEHEAGFHHEPVGPGFGPGFGRGFGGHRGPGPHGHGPGPRRRGMRAARGDVRTAVLLRLAEAPMHGYELMQQIAELSEGMWRPSPGTLYPVLAQLEDEGLIEINHESGRKVARLTDAGREYVEQNAERLGDPFEALREALGERVDLRGPVEELAGAARQLARSGSKTQQEKARQVLREARRSLYLILAEDEPDAGSPDADSPDADSPDGEFGEE